MFGYRINTIFKFYYQTWLLWSLAAAYPGYPDGFTQRIPQGPGVSDYVDRIGDGIVLSNLGITIEDQ